MKILLIMLVLFCGCAVKATKNGDTMILRGWGAQSAEWNSDGSSKISKEEPIKTPDILPQR